MDGEISYAAYGSDEQQGGGKTIKEGTLDQRSGVKLCQQFY
jgi:hypothetical protein